MTDFNTSEPKVKDSENIYPKQDSYKPLIDEWLAGVRQKKSSQAASHSQKSLS